MKDLTAIVRKSEGWYAVEVPEIPGLFTQTGRFGHIRDMVADAAALLLPDVPDGGYRITVRMEPE